MKDIDTSSPGKMETAAARLERAVARLEAVMAKPQPAGASGATVDADLARSVAGRLDAAILRIQSLLEA